jgi:hypothetical protein
MTEAGTTPTPPFLLKRQAPRPGSNPCSGAVPKTLSSTRTTSPTTPALQSAPSSRARAGQPPPQVCRRPLAPKGVLAWAWGLGLVGRPGPSQRRGRIPQEATTVPARVGPALDPQDREACKDPLGRLPGAHRGLVRLEGQVSDAMVQCGTSKAEMKLGDVGDVV